MRWLLVAIWLCGTVVATAAEPRRGPPKPSAPVDVRIDARPTGGATYVVTLTATPRRDVKGLVLDLDGRRTVIGATAKGQARTVTARISLGALRGRDIAGGATVDVGAGRRRAAASARLGVAPPPPPPVNLVRLPDGTYAAEVRP